MESLNLSHAYSPIEASIHLVRYEFAGNCGLVGRVLDVACGHGYGALRLAARPGVEAVTGVDRDPEALAAAAALAAASPAPVRFERVDLAASPEALDALGPFDSVVSIETLEHLAEPERLLARLAGLWTRRGPFVISLPNDPLYWGRGESLNPFHLRSGSWIEGRGWSERVLGEGRWFFGSVANGFAIHSLDGATVQAPRYDQVLARRLRPVAGLRLPNRTATPLLPQNALFYMGVWPGETAADCPETAALFPTDARHRLPDFLSAPAAVQAGLKPKLLLVADVEGWAYDNIAKTLARFLGSRFRVEIAYHRSFEGKTHAAIRRYLFDADAEFVHFFWRETIVRFLSSPAQIAKFCARHEIAPADFARRLAEVTITAGIYDHLFLEPEQLAPRLPRLGLLDGVSVSSRRLQRLYAAEAPDLATTVLEDGVDPELFRPKDLARFEDAARPLVVGWVGNALWNQTSGLDPKGLHSLLKPALAALAAEGLPIVGHFADRNERWRPREEMPDYYAEIDVLVCVSLHEGTPNPVLEAVACGVPVITTDVGLVPEVLGEAQKRFVLREREIEPLKQALRRLCLDRGLLRRLSEENLARREDLAWRRRMPRWLVFFRQAEARNRLLRPAKRALLADLAGAGALAAERDAVRKANAQLRARIAALDGRLAGIEAAQARRAKRAAKKTAPPPSWRARLRRRLAGLGRRLGMVPR